MKRIGLLEIGKKNLQIHLLNNDNYRLSIGKAGSDYVQREWRWDLVKDAFSSLLKGN